MIQRGDVSRVVALERAGLVNRDPLRFARIGHVLASPKLIEIMRTYRLSSLGTFTAGLSVVLLVGACTSSTPSRSPTLAPDASLDVNRPLVGRRAILTRADLASVQSPISTLEAVRRLRPEFLHPSERAVGRTTSDMSLYVNDVYEGEVWQLNSLPLYLIREITFLHPTEATARFGLRCRCPGGAISVRTLIQEK